MKVKLGWYPLIKFFVSAEKHRISFPKLLRNFSSVPQDQTMQHKNCILDIEKNKIAENLLILQCQKYLKN